jgi:hypothetical protein
MHPAIRSSEIDLKHAPSRANAAGHAPLMCLLTLFTPHFDSFLPEFAKRSPEKAQIEGLRSRLALVSLGVACPKTERGPV